MARHQKRTFGEILLAGSKVKIGAQTVAVLMRDSAEKILMCCGTTKPTDGNAGYAAGCKFIKDDGTVYYNAGSVTSCKFVAPTHLVVYGENAHAGANNASTLTIDNADFRATDIPMVNMRVNASSRNIIKVTMTDGHMTITWDGNVAITDTFDYVVFRAIH